MTAKLQHAVRFTRMSRAQRVHAPTGFLILSRFCIVVAVLISHVSGAPDFFGPKEAEAQEPLLEKPRQAEEGMVQLNFPKEVELKGLVDYVSKRLGVKFLYDEEIAGKRISLRAPGAIPAESLLMVLQSALKMKGMAMVDAGVPGWKRIVSTAKLTTIAPAGEAEQVIGKLGAASPVMQVFMLQHADAQQVTQVIKPFLTQPGGNSTPLKDSGVLIVTDYASNILKIAKLVKLIDRPKPDVTMEFLPVRNVEVSSLAGQVTSLLSAKSKAQGVAGVGVAVAHDVRTNQLVLVGTREEVDAVVGLVRSLDVPLGLTTEVYHFQYVSAQRVDRLIQKLVDPLRAKRLYKSAVDAEGNMLIATTTPEIHNRLRSLKASMDLPATQRHSPIRFYKLKNTTVNEVLETLRSIEGISSPTVRPEKDADGVMGPAVHNRVEGAFRLPLRPGQQPPPLRLSDGTEQTGPDNQPQMPWATEGAAPGLFPGGARITADTNTNSLIVVAAPAVQKVYEELIRSLDHRRPQVLIEAKIIAIDTSDDFSLGVEISGGDRLGIKRLFAFSSFGLSTVDPVTGALALLPGMGFNGTLVDPEVADVVLRAMAKHTRARILASPRILVNDNSQGELQSVLSVPFSSVNASQTVSTTSLGGNQDAGTTINVTPHISEGDHLQLEFSIEFSSFGQGGNDALPPPRQIDQISSTVTIPDGHTVIVGGLNRHDRTQAVSALPWIENIPILKYAASNRSRNKKCSSLFIFIRPIILRDDKFKDLKFLSNRDTTSAKIPGRYPTSQPLLIR